MRFSLCVGYDRQLRHLMSSEGLLAALPRGTIVAVLSTVHPRTVKELAEDASAAGVHLIDSTMCRGGRAADEGTLLSFVGGDADVVERLKPVLASYSSDIVHTGGVGTAQVAKAANNLIMWACLIANHEALALAKRFGMDVDLLREALLKSSADQLRARALGREHDGVGGGRHGDRPADGARGRSGPAASRPEPRVVPDAEAEKIPPRRVWRVIRCRCGADLYGPRGEP